MQLGPRPANAQDERSLASVVQNPNRDASLMMDVKVERIKRAAVSSELPSADLPWK